MPAELYTFSVTVPAGTPQAAPVTVATTLPERTVTRVEVVVPPGCRGQVGWQVASSGTQQYPVNPGGWVVTDGEIVGWDVATPINSGDWQVVAYNTGVNPHTLQVRYYCDLLEPPARTGIGLMDSATLNSGPAGP